jgi:hypothetical protein
MGRIKEQHSIAILRGPTVQGGANTADPTNSGSLVMVAAMRWPVWTLATGQAWSLQLLDEDQADSDRDFRLFCFFFLCRPM